MGSIPIVLLLWSPTGTCWLSERSYWKSIPLVCVCVCVPATGHAGWLIGVWDRSVITVSHRITQERTEPIIASSYLCLQSQSLLHRLKHTCKHTHYFMLCNPIKLVPFLNQPLSDLFRLKVSGLYNCGKGRV